jgi:beta-lactamase class A
VVALTYGKVTPPRPSFQNLQVLLKQIIDVSKFEGITELYLVDLQTNQEMHFAYQQGKNLPGDIGFTAASTIKIPIMVSSFRRMPEPSPQIMLDNLAKMIEFSENDPADRLMESLDKNTGPLEVTKDIQALGLKSTFLAGYFYPGAPLLKRFNTPANQRKDYFTDPDPYNQTTPAEMGQLLNDIFQCAESGGGAFAAVFPGEISQAECVQMVNFLKLNRLPMLMTAGLPEGTTIAHKHGWITEADGLLHSVSDAGIIYTPGGNYIVAIYMWQKEQLLFDPANVLVADLSRAIYNYFNQITQ